MLCRVLYKLSISVKQEKIKVTKSFWKFCMKFFFFTFFKNFDCKTRAKFFNKENIKAVEITSSCSLYIC